MDPSFQEDFARELVREGACFRCVLLVFRCESRHEYRLQSYMHYENLIGLKEPETCFICLGVIQRAESYTE